MHYMSTIASRFGRQGLAGAMRGLLLSLTGSLIVLSAPAGTGMVLIEFLKALAWHASARNAPARLPAAVGAGRGGRH